MCIYLLLQPRRFKYKVRQKDRRCIMPQKTKQRLTYGNAGLLLLQPLSLTGSQVSKLILFLKRATRRSDKTFRVIWFFAFPHLPLSRKPNGVRMGKGKGKLHAWFTTVAKGIILFESINLRRGRSYYFFRQTTFKLGIRTRFLYVINLRLVLPFYSAKTTFVSSFWF